MMKEPAAHGLSPPRGRSTGGRGKCDCCPYGYHLELDFVRYCEKVAASGLLQSPGRRSTLPRQTRKRRESRESLLGLRTQEAVREARSHSDDLERAVLDFELMLDSSTRPLIEESRIESVNEPMKFRPMCADKIRDSFTDWKLTGPNNASAVILQEIREQMASSLRRMRHLEEEVKTIPNLQNQLKKLRWENRRLVKLLETAERKQEVNINFKTVPPGKESQTVQRRTIGTGCSVLQRTVGTSHCVSSKDIGTDPPVHVRTPGHHAAVQTNARKTFTLDFGSQTDLYLLKVFQNGGTIQQFSTPTEPKSGTIGSQFRDPIEPSVISVGCQCDLSPKPRLHSVGCQNDLLHKPRLYSVGCQYDISPKPKLYSVGCQNDLSPKPSLLSVGCQKDLSLEPVRHTVGSQYDIRNPSVCDVGVQFSMEKEKKSTQSIGVQFDNTSLKVRSFKAVSCQTNENPVSQKKEVGVQNKPQSSHIGIIAKIMVLTNSTQTTSILKKDVGLTVNIIPQSLPKKSIGTTMDLEKTPEKKIPCFASKLNDTADLLSKSNAAVNTEEIIVFDSTAGTDSLETQLNKVESNQKCHTNQQPSFIQEKPKPSSIPVYKTSQVERLRHNENVRHYEELQEKSSPQSPHGVPKPYEKKEPSKEMKGAMKVLNDNLLKSPSSEIPKTMRNAVNIVQQEWFKISSTADANPLDVEDYLDCFEELSVALLEYIVNETDVSGNTAMHYAVSNGNFDVVSILLDSKVCNINKLNTAGYTCIMLVALTKVKSDTDRQVVRRLFQMADVNIRARQHGQTALMLAVSHGRIDTVELLLESGADINIQDEDGSTALMCAAEHGYIDIVKLLLAQPDCDLSITDLDGNTALNIAMEAGNRDIGVLLYAQEHFSRGASPFSTLKIRRAKSATPTLKTRTPTPPNCSQEHSL